MWHLAEVWQASMDPLPQRVCLFTHTGVESGMAELPVACGPFIRFPDGMIE
ncbi:hypothetical protein [Hydrogenophaga laconesensis]|uniref:hypothetical protein n=1 Tax=Hydrogenophaga laconesensis TaxID=1805971 RepID=UPI00286D3B94|nr:hypothetical protein [Hydrogenophaga laconesensis]